MFILGKQRNSLLVRTVQFPARTYRGGRSHPETSYYKYNDDVQLTHNDDKTFVFRWNDHGSSERSKHGLLLEYEAVCRVEAP